MINPMNMTGKHILITGATGGIGEAAAVKASKLGAKLSLTGRNEEKLKQVFAGLSGEGHRCYAADLTQINEIESLIKSVVDNGDKLDGFANCMGIGQNRPLKMIKFDFLQSIFQTNFYPFVELARVITKKKFSNNNASIVGISSVAAFRGDKAQGAYSASKAASDAIIKSMAKELCERKIRINNVAFGMVNTDMYKAFLNEGGADETIRNQYMGVGSPDDAANVICFLLSNASAFITGTTLIADGGYLS